MLFESVLRIDVERDSRYVTPHMIYPIVLSSCTEKNHLNSLLSS